MHLRQVEKKTVQQQPWIISETGNFLPEMLKAKSFFLWFSALIFITIRTASGNGMLACWDKSMRIGGISTSHHGSCMEVKK